MDTKLFKCDICNKTFTLKSNLIRHNRSHRPRLSSLSCHKCHKNYSRSDSLKRHVCDDEKTPSETVFKCETGFKCETCCKRFSRKDNLKVHKKKCDLKKVTEDEDRLELDMTKETRLFPEITTHVLS